MKSIDWVAFDRWVDSFKPKLTQAELDILNEAYNKLKEFCDKYPEIQIDLQYRNKCENKSSS